MDGSADLLTVVTVVRNDPIGLEATLKSVCEQSVVSRMILVDGASSDGTLEVARKAANFPHLQVVSEPDFGPYDAMNKALKLVQSRYVLFMNAGDTFFDSESLASIVDGLNAHQGMWLVGGHAISDGRGGHHSTQIPTNLKRGGFLIGRQSICHQSVVVRADSLRQLGGFDTKFRICADFKLIIQLWTREPPFLLMKPIAIYQPGGLSDESLGDNFRERSEIRTQLGFGSKAIFFKSLVWFRYFSVRRFLGGTLDRLASRGLVPRNWRVIKGRD